MPSSGVAIEAQHHVFAKYINYLDIFPKFLTLYGLVKTRTTRTPAFWEYPPPPHDYPYYWVILDPKSWEDKVKVTNLKNLLRFPILKFCNKIDTWYTFWSCLIRNIKCKYKWSQQVLLKIQSGQDHVHRRTDRQTNGRTDRRTRWTSIPPSQLRWSGGIIIYVGS